MIQCAFAYHNLATGNTFNSPDGVMHRTSKERNGGGKNPMIGPLQTTETKYGTSPVSKLIYVHFFRFGVASGK